MVFLRVKGSSFEVKSGNDNLSVKGRLRMHSVRLSRSMFFSHFLWYRSYFIVARFTKIDVLNEEEVLPNI